MEDTETRERESVRCSVRRAALDPGVPCRHLYLRQGLRHADENGGGGDGDQAAANPGFSSEATHTKSRKLSGFGPLFSSKWGDYPPLSQKWGEGGRVPPSPLWRSP